MGFYIKKSHSEFNLQEDFKSLYRSIKPLKTNQFLPPNNFKHKWSVRNPP